MRLRAEFPQDSLNRVVVRTPKKVKSKALVYSLMQLNCDTRAIMFLV